MATRSLRIGIDARVLAEPAPMGVARYFTALLRAVAQVAPHHEYRLYLNQRPLNEEAFAAPPFWHREIGGKGLLASPLIWQQLVLPWAIWRDQVDVLLSPYYCGPLFPPVPHIVFLYDVSFAAFPHDFPSWVRFKPKLLARPTCRKADCVLTISEFSRQEILERFALPSSKVKVVTPGYEQDMWPRSRPRASLGIFPDQHPFFLFAGSLLPRRQVSCVVQALAQLPPQYHFVVVGENDGERQSALKAVAQKWNVAGRVHILGHVSDEDLEDLYLRTLALISPSTYEGFGLPVLEAMIRGVPVVAWDIPIMREVVGEAGLLIKSGDIRALAGALGAIATSTEQRALLKQKGYAQAKKFSWKSAAAHFLEILDETTAGGRNLAHNV